MTRRKSSTVLWLLALACAASNCPSQEEAIPGLIKQLGAPEIGARDEAMRRLLAVGTAAIPALEKALSSDDLEIRSRAAKVLKIFGNRKYVSPLLLNVFPDAENTLAGNDPHAWTELFLKAVEEKAELRAYPQLGHDVIGMFVEPALRHVKTPQEAGRILEVASAWNLRQSVQEVIQLANSPSKNAQRESIAALGELCSDEQGGDVSAHLRHASPDVRAAAAVAFGKMKESGPVELLRPLLLDEHEEVRIAALRAAKRMKGTPLVEDVTQILRRGAPQTQSEALATLVHLAPAKTRELVPGLLEKQDPRIMATAAWAAGMLGIKESLPALELLLAEKHVGTSTSAAAAIRELTGQDRSGVLLRLLDGGSQQDRLISALWLCSQGQRGAVPVLLVRQPPEPGTLFLINAVRCPELWAKLDRETVFERIRGTPRSFAASLAAQLGLKLEWKAKDNMENHAWNWRVFKTSSWDAPVRALACLAHLSEGPYEVLLESDRIRMLPRQEAREFWIRWAAEEGIRK